jgi:hypothetical protein
MQQQRNTIKFLSCQRAVQKRGPTGCFNRPRTSHTAVQMSVHITYTAVVL